MNVRDLDSGSALRARAALWAAWLRLRWPVWG